MLEMSIMNLDNVCYSNSMQTSLHFYPFASHIFIVRYKWDCSCGIKMQAIYIYKGTGNRTKVDWAWWSWLVGEFTYCSLVLSWALPSSECDPTFIPVYSPLSPDDVPSCIHSAWSTFKLVDVLFGLRLFCNIKAIKLNWTQIHCQQHIRNV